MHHLQSLNCFGSVAATATKTETVTATTPVRGRRSSIGAPKTIVLSYKTSDEKKDNIISACARELENRYGYDVYFELRNMQPGRAFEDQVCTVNVIIVPFDCIF